MTSLAAVAAQSPADLSKLISKVLEEKLAQLGIKLSKPPNSPRGSGVPGSKGAYRKTRRDSPPKERKGSPSRKSDGTAPSLGWRVRRTRTTSLAPKLMHFAGGVAGQATRKAIARSARETTGGTIRYGPYRSPS